MKQIEAKTATEDENSSDKERLDAESFTVRRHNNSVLTSFEHDDSNLLETDIFGHTLASPPTSYTEESIGKEGETTKEVQQDVTAEHAKPSEEEVEEEDENNEVEQEDNEPDDDFQDDDEDHESTTVSKTGAHDTTSSNPEADEEEQQEDAEEPPEEPSVPTDNVVHDTAEGIEVEIPSQRDASAKDSIPSFEVSEENISNPEPDDSRPGLQQYNL